jgi:hypothetical protein
MSDFKVGDRVTKPGYGYYGKVYKIHTKYRTEWAAVMWEGAAYTVNEYPHNIEACPERPARVVRYN